MTETGREERARRWPAALAAAGLAVAAAALMLAAGVEVPWRVAAGALGAGLAGFGAGLLRVETFDGDQARNTHAGIVALNATLLDLAHEARERLVALNATLLDVAHEVRECFGTLHTALLDKGREIRASFEVLLENRASDRLPELMGALEQLLRLVGAPDGELTLWGRLDLFQRVWDELNAQGVKGYEMRLATERRVATLEAGNAGAAPFVALLRSLAEAAEKAARPPLVATVGGQVLDLRGNLGDVSVVVGSPRGPLRFFPREVKVYESHGALRYVPDGPTLDVSWEYAGTAASSEAAASLLPVLEAGMVVVAGGRRFRLGYVEAREYTCAACYGGGGKAETDGGCRECGGRGRVTRLGVGGDPVNVESKKDGGVPF